MKHEIQNTSKYCKLDILTFELGTADIEGFVDGCDVGWDDG